MAELFPTSEEELLPYRLIGFHNPGLFDIDDLQRVPTLSTARRKHIVATQLESLKLGIANQVSLADLSLDETFPLKAPPSRRRQEILGARVAILQAQSIRAQAVLDGLS